MAGKTVYVIGAGASYEANLPTGAELKSKIAHLLDMRFDFGNQKSGDFDIFSALQKHASEHPASGALDHYIQECRYISANMPLAISIDNLIDTNRGNERLALCGKLAILKSILSAERSSNLNFQKNSNNQKPNFSKIENTWYLPFFKSLTENCSVQDLPARFQSITLIIFNYDRCIENFLLFSLMSLYRLSVQEVAELMNHLKVVHPYGTVGSLNWLNPLSSTLVAFGEELHSRQLVSHSAAIRTFTEGAHSDYVQQMKLSMENTERLIFLGFAFHKLNMELLGGYEQERAYENKNKIECYATAYGASKSDQEEIRKVIKYLYKNEVEFAIENCTCTQMFLNYSRSLGFS